MILRLYSWLLWLAQPALRRKLRRRAVAEPVYGEALEERFGHYQGLELAAGAPVVWVHAVSLGETIASAVLVQQLRQALPGMRLLLTHGTATGRAHGKSLLQPGDMQVWQPWDTPGAVRRFLNHFRPSVGLLIETEIWPNLVASCKQRGVPLCLVNARLSEASLAKAQRLAWLSRPAYRGLRAVWAQAPADAQRLAQLGAPVRGVFGNFKFDALPDAQRLAQGCAWRRAMTRPVVTLAISREGEEETWLDCLVAKWAPAHNPSTLVATNYIASDVQWMVVPRHPQRFDAVVQACEARGFSVLRRSQWGAEGPMVSPPGARVIWVGDSLGDMALYYGMSDVALLGGSFAPLGGQNLIEAAACECPVIMGPHTFNFEQAAALSLEAGAAQRVADLAQAVESALRWVSDPQSLQSAAQAARALTRAHQGAAQRTTEAVLALLAASKITA